MATPAQSSQAASVSVHPTVHAKGWEGWEGGWKESPALVPALLSLQHEGMTLGQHLVFGQAGFHENKGLE